MNVKELAENLGLEAEEFLELLQLFIETGKGDLDNLFSAATAGDAEGAVKAAHSLKGAAGNLGLDEIYEAAKGLEQIAREGLLINLSAPAQALKEEVETLARYAHM